MTVDFIILRKYFNKFFLGWKIILTILPSQKILISKDYFLK